MECLISPNIVSYNKLYPENEPKVFVREILNHIKDNVNRVEFSSILDNLHHLCGNPKFVEITDGENHNHFTVTLFFFSEGLRQAVQDVITKRSIDYDVTLDAWQLISSDDLHGLRLSDIQTTLIFGRDHYHSVYVQTILKKLNLLQKESQSLTKLPSAFLSQLCADQRPQQLLSD